VRRRASAALAPWLLPLGVASLFGHGCASPPAPAPPPPAAFYWQARAPGGALLFLLGSVHVGKQGQELAPPLEMELDWARAEELVVELDLNALPDLERLDAVQRHGLLPPETTLRDVVSAATWSALVPYLRGHGYPLEAASRMRPWLVAQQIAQLEFAAAGYDPENGVDAWFLRRAEDVERPIAQLESLEEQLAAFGTLSASVEEALLHEMLEQSGAFLETSRAILWAWEHGDEAGLLELLLGTRHDPQLAAFHRTVFTLRNHRMAARLAGWAADGRARFVVVGTGHLIGPDSVPALLERYGFAVERRPDAYLRSYDPAALPVAPPAGAHP
jgi:uncharacterized protein YbaP (TraB family)